LLGLVEDGLSAVSGRHRAHLADEIKNAFTDSLEIDENLKDGRDRENRWDYLLGHGALSCVIGMEPHTAKDQEVKTVIRKKQSAQQQLREHLQKGTRIEEWYWVASGKNRFLDTEKTRRLLDQNGICFICPKLHAKDLANLKERLDQAPWPGRRR